MLECVRKGRLCSRLYLHQVPWRGSSGSESETLSELLTERSGKLGDTTGLHYRRVPVHCHTREASLCEHVKFLVLLAMSWHRCVRSVQVVVSLQFCNCVLES